MRPAVARQRRPLSARWRNTLFVPAATALAIVIVALVVAARIGLDRAERRPDRTACAAPRRRRRRPPRDAARPDLLAAGVDGIPFPVYVSSPGWRATGSRTQVVHQRKIVTVYYRAPDGTRVGYSIVPGHYLAPQSNSSIVRDGVRYWFGRVGSGRYMTWVRGGHTCVIAGTSVSPTRRC